jgi:CDP-paratose 2-epimerase
VDDLVNACWLAFQNRNRLAGNVFNIGGGPTNTVSLLELLKLIGSEQGSAPKIAFGAVRQGDQRYFVSDTGLFSQRTGWQARVTVEEGVRRLRQWLADNRNNQLEPVLARVAA